MVFEDEDASLFCVLLHERVATPKFGEMCQDAYKRLCALQVE